MRTIRMIAWRYLDAVQTLDKERPWLIALIILALIVSPLLGMMILV